MIPKAKKNLHACEYHLQNMMQSKHFEEVEINFAAFVNAARNVTFVLQKEYKRNPKFIEWYGDLEKEKILCEHCGKKAKFSAEITKDSKQFMMKNDNLCTFFVKIRNNIIKEGLNGLNCSTDIISLNSSEDFPDKPKDASLAFTPQGIYYHIQKGTANEDFIPALSRTAEIITHIFIADAPKTHMQEKISNPSLIEISKLYYKFLKNLVEEWTGIINKDRELT